jgi:eukaryotic-like serine/threonine-protein kinase
MSGLEGTTLDHYQIQRRLGHGGMADVYLAYDNATDRDVAIKVLSGSQTTYLERFRREAEAIDKLQHKHILPVYDYGDQEPWHYLVMPYITAGTLSDLLDEGPLPLQQAAAILDQIASALQFAHDHGIIHRDIKPSNILLGNNTYIFLADFGLAKAIEGTNELTQTGVLLGTPEYMAPDLADGPATTSSDIYALGILLYQMVTGRVPFLADTPVAVYWKQIREQPLPPSRINPDLSNAIDSVILRVLDKNPLFRYRSARDLAAAFRSALLAPAVLPNTDDFLLSRNMQERPRSHNTKDEPSTPSHPSLHPGLHPSARRFARTRRNRGRNLPQSGSILPNDAFMTPATTAPSAGKIPPLPPRLLETAVPEPISRPSAAEQRPVPPEQRRKLNKLATTVIAIGLALFIVLPMTYIYYIYRSHNGQAMPTSASIANTTRNATPTKSAQQSTSHDPISVAKAAQNAVLTSQPVLIDGLTSNTLNRWTVDGSHCTFGNGGYAVNDTQVNYLQSCPMLSPTVSNSAVEVDVSLLGGTSADVLFRFNGDQYYDFEITSSNQFSFARHDASSTSNSSYSYLIKQTYSSAILAMGQKNTLLLIANGADFKLYINGTFVGDAQDSTYSGGQLALATGTSGLVTTGQAIFSNLKLFKME